MSDDGRDESVSPTSEVGSKRVKEKSSGDNLESTQWRLMFEMQNEQMRSLIQALNMPGPRNNVTLPEFDPDKQDADPQSWCTTADLCLSDTPLNGCQLIVALSKALKGTASTWLSQVSYAGITWPQFKELFCERFVPTETIPATLIQLNTSRPKEGESYAAYASRLISSLMNRWKNANMEQIAVSVVLAHLAQTDTRLQRLAFTTEINSRHNLQKELQAFSYLKHKVPHADDTSDNVKRPRMSTAPMKCYMCGKPGHKQIDCRLKGKKHSTPTTTHIRPSQQSTQKEALICFKCGQPGHIASRCGSVAPVATTSSTAVPRAERRVDLCTVEPPSGALRHNEEIRQVHQKRVDLTEVSGNWLLAEQQRDQDIQKVITQLNNCELKDDIAHTYENNHHTWTRERRMAVSETVMSIDGKRSAARVPIEGCNGAVTSSADTRLTSCYNRV
ncbi:unnamed protein product [Danaus chrysippus]|uniref:(African queen) hypothetical protein n=1 Tax=Danaus chrysippus TaxID=151541 RepID=A0A8J2QEC6_9NEOP|nr:unnamed protein product [Danaus chrysippus]